MTMTTDVFEPRPVEDTAAYQSLMRVYDAELRYSASGNVTDKAALLETLDPEIVLYQPESLPYGGVWRGHEAFGEWLDAFVQNWMGITPTGPVFHACGQEILITTVIMNASARSTGIKIVMPMCQVIRFSDDLPIEWRNFAWDSARMNEALNPAGSARIAT